MKIINAVFSSASVLALTISAGSAQALVTVNISGTDYSVDTFTGKYDDNTDKFNATLMPWFGDQALADQFAVAVGNAFGKPNPPNFGGDGPVFAWFINEFDVSGQYLDFQDIPVLVGVDKTQTFTYAYVPAAEVPGPLPIFGAAAAFGMSRRLRRRIRLDSGSRQG